MLRRLAPPTASLLFALSACEPPSPDVGEVGRTEHAVLDPAGPDLQVARLNARYSSVDGQTYIEPIVCNYGVAATPVGDLDVRMTTGTTYSATAPLALSYNSPQVILPGECTSLGIRGALLTPGANDYLMAMVDPTDLRAETDESNNVLLGPQVFAADLPDLRVVSIEVMGRDESADTPHIRWVICNEGTASIPQGVYASTQLSTTSGGWPTWSSNKQLHLLAPQECYVGLTQLPTGDRGVRYLTVVADYFQGLTELDEQNNAATYPVRLNHRASEDLMVADVTLPKALASPSTLHTRICNVGSGLSAPSTIEVLTSGSATRPGSTQPPAGTYAVPSLGAAECFDADVRFTPTTTGNSFVYTSVRVVPGVVDLSGNNWMLGGAQIPLAAAMAPQPDLVVERVEATNAIGGAANVALTVCNNGDAASPTAWVSIEDTLDNQGGLLLRPSIAPVSATIPGLAPSTCRTQSVPFTPSQPSGEIEVRLTVVVDPSDAIAEHDESNNVLMSDPIYVVGSGWDLRLEAASATRSNSTDVDLAFRVCNDGNLVAPGLSGVLAEQERRILPLDLLQVGGAVFSTGTSVSAGACEDRSAVVPLRLGLGADTVMVGVSGSFIGEVDRRNGFLPLYPVQNRVELVGLELDAPGIVAPGALFDVTLRYCGNGGDRLPTTVDVYLDRDPEAGAHQHLLTTMTVTPPIVGVCSSNTQTAVVPGTISGEWQLGVRPAEYQADSLQAARRILVTSGTNLVARLVSPPTAGNLAASVEVCNEGNTAAGASDVRLVLSRDDEFPGPVLPVGASDTVIATTIVPALAANSCTTLPLTGSLFGVSPGAYRLAAYVDWSDSVTEVLEDDNASRAIDFSVGPAICGNGLQEGSEACDDGNLAPGDGCDDTCNLEASPDAGVDAGTFVDASVDGGLADAGVADAGTAHDAGSGGQDATVDASTDGGTSPDSGSTGTAGQWTPVGSLAQVRNKPGSAVLPSGEVIVFGGYSGTADLTSAEIYNPATGSFRATGSMVIPRYNLRSTTLLDGRVLVFGPENAGNTTEGEIFDPVTETWRLVASHPDSGWTGPAVTLLDGRVLVTKGPFALNTLLYDPATDTWQTTTSPRVISSGHGAVRLQDGRVLLVAPDAAAEVYDPVTATWTRTLGPTMRHLDSLTLLQDGRVLLAGGRVYANGSYSYPVSTEIFDPSTSSWAPGPNLLEPRYAHSARRLADGRVLLVGGYQNPTPANTVSLATTEIFDPASNTVSSGPPLNGARGYPIVEVLSDGSVVAAAGYNGGPLGTAEVYVPTAAPPGTDAGLPDVGTGDAGAVMDATTDGGLDAAVADAGGPGPDSGSAPDAGGLMDGGLIADGGSNDAGAVATERWVFGNSLLTERRYAKAVRLMSGELLIIGGQDDTRATLRSCEIFDPTTGLFRSTSPMLRSTWLITEAKLLSDGRVLVFGIVLGAPDVRGEIFDPITETWTVTSPKPGGGVSVVETLGSGLVLVGSVGMNQPAYLYDPVTDTWNLTGAPVSDHQTGTAIRLDDGRVLVFSGGGPAELYDPATGSWSSANQAFTPRYDSTATLLSDGRVLLAGGRSNPGGGVPSTFHDTTQLYDPTTNDWLPGPTMTTDRSLHSATRLSDGRVMIASGFRQTGPNSVSRTPSVDIFDPASNSIVPAPDLNTPRTSAMLTTLPDGTPMVLAGDNGTVLASTELYVSTPASGSDGGLADAATQDSGTVFDASSDGGPTTDAGVQPDAEAPDSGAPPDAMSTDATIGDVGSASDAGLSDAGTGSVGSWVAGPDLILPRSGSAAYVTLLTGEVLIVGGQAQHLATPNCEIFDPATGLFRATAQNPLAGSWFRGDVLLDGRVLVLPDGGTVGTLFDPVTETWTLTSALPGSSYARHVVALRNGLVLVITGGQNTQSLLYVPSSDTWHPTGASIEEHHNGATALLQDGRVLVAGSGAGIAPEIYDPSTGTWSLAGGPTAPRVVSASLVALQDGRAFMAGGSTSPGGLPFTYTDSTYLFDPITSTWSPGPTMSVQRAAHSAVQQLDGRVLLIGGYRDDLGNGIVTPLTTVEVFEPVTNTIAAGPSLAGARQHPISARLSDGNVLVAGGWNNTLLRTSEIYLAGAGTSPDGGVDAGIALDSGVHPDATVPDTGAALDAGFPDSGVHPDAAVPDTGVLVDAGFPDSGVHPDAAVPDTGVLPDAGFPDTGVHPDAAVPDTGVVLDAGFPDSGIPAGPYVPAHVTFDSTFGQRLSTSVAGNGLSGSNGFTIAMWAQYDGTTFHPLIDRFDPGQEAFWIGHYPQDTISVEIPGPGGGIFQSFATSFAPGTWHHLVIRYDAAGALDLWLDGVPDNGPSFGAVPGSLPASSSNLNLGDTGAASRIGEVVFFDRPLDALDTADLLCTFATPGTACTCGSDNHVCTLADVFAMPGLLSYWPMATGPNDEFGVNDLTETNGPLTYFVGNAGPNQPPPDGGVGGLDAGFPDSGVIPDAGFPDTGVIPDAGLVDSGVIPDAGFLDTGVIPDAGLVDSGVIPDVGFPDSGVLPDAGFPDTGVIPDAGFPDTGVIPDAGFPDTGVLPDAGFVDSGVPPGPFVPAHVLFDSSVGQSLSTSVAGNGLSGANGFTILMWAQFDGTVFHPLIDRFDPGQEALWIGHYPQDTISVEIPGPGGGIFQSFATSFAPGTWHHLAIRYDAAGTLDLWLDGVPDNGPSFGAVPASLPASSSNLNLGDPFATSRLGEVVFFDRPLGTIDMADALCTFTDSIRTCTCSGNQPCTLAALFAMPGLQSYWPMSTGPTDSFGANDLAETNGPLLYTPGSGGPLP